MIFYKVPYFLEKDPRSNNTRHSDNFMLQIFSILCSVTFEGHGYFLRKLEIKPCRLGPRIRDMEAFWYKTEIKIIYFVPLCLIGLDFIVYPNPKFLIFKTKNQPLFF
jgi:hypothetical protein